MSGLGTSNTSQSQSSQTSPWAPAQGDLTSLLGSIGGQMGNYAPNQAEQTALGQLQTNATNQPNYGGQVGAMTSGYLGGDPTGLLNPALSQYNQTMGQFTNPASLNPMTAPGMQGTLQTIQNDVGNSVNQQFAGAGRSGSGMNQQTLARGISQGESGALLGQYNQNVGNMMGAAGGMLGAAQGTAGQITGNQQQGIGMAGAAQQMQNAPAMAQLQAQATARGLPLNNLGMLENLTVPIAGLGGQSSGQSQGSYTASPLTQFQQLSGGLFGNGGMFKGLFG